MFKNWLKLKYQYFHPHIFCSRCVASSSFRISAHNQRMWSCAPWSWGLPPLAHNERKWWVSWLSALMEQHKHAPSLHFPVFLMQTPRFICAIKHLHLNLSPVVILPPASFLPLCVSDPRKGGVGSPPRSGAGSVPAADRAEPGSSASSSSCSTNLLPLRPGQDLPGHLSWTRPGSPLDRDAIDPYASPPHPRGRHEGPRGVEGAQQWQREMGGHQGEGEREAVAAEGAEGHTDARDRARWAEGCTDSWMKSSSFEHVHVQPVWLRVWTKWPTSCKQTSPHEYEICNILLTSTISLILSAYEVNLCKCKELTVTC